jgi:hypothetical protein
MKTERGQASSTHRELEMHRISGWQTAPNETNLGTKVKYKYSNVSEIEGKGNIGGK